MQYNLIYNIFRQELNNVILVMLRQTASVCLSQVSVMLFH